LSQLLISAGIKSPVRTIETNVHLTEVVLSQAAKKQKARSG